VDSAAEARLLAGPTLFCLFVGITFAFDALMSVFDDRTPNVFTDEIDVNLPCPEYLFMTGG
jgi:hypothetical protein